MPNPPNPPPADELSFAISEAELDDLMNDVSADPDSFDSFDSPEGAPEAHALPPPDIKGADFANLSEAELAEIPVINAQARGASNEFAFTFLSDVRDEFEAFGIACRHYVFQFPRRSGASALTSFKRNLTVRISRIRRAAAEQGTIIPPFWVTFTHEQPLSPDENNHAKIWLCTVARMNETKYRGYARDRSKQQAANSAAHELLEKSIGVLL